MNLTTNFTLSEFMCHDGNAVPEKYYANVQRVADQLQILRNYLKEPIRINSAYRTYNYNKKIGGAPGSQHLIGNATDIIVRSKTPKQLAAIVEKLIASGDLKFKGLGIYKSFIHVDMRPKRARWTG